MPRRTKTEKLQKSFPGIEEGHQLGLALRGAYLAVHRRVNALLRSHGVTGEQFVLLSYLHEGDSITQSDLAKRASSDANTIRPMLGLLQAAGLIERKKHPTDGRATAVVITSAGRRRFVDMALATDQCRREMLSSVGSSGTKNLIAKLRAMSDRLSEPR
jgi:DNA-binding MarR family transcriptional regulator